MMPKTSIRSLATLLCCYLLAFAAPRQARAAFTPDQQAKANAAGTR